MKKLLFIFAIIVSSPVWAADECVTIDTSGWDQNQNVHMVDNASIVMGKAGFNITPTRTTNTLCFENGPANTTAIITKRALEKEHYRQENAKTPFSADHQAKKTEMEELDADIRNYSENWNSLSVLQQNDAMKKELRREVLRQELGE